MRGSIFQYSERIFLTVELSKRMSKNNCFVIFYLMSNDYLRLLTTSFAIYKLITFLPYLSLQKGNIYIYI